MQAPTQVLFQQLAADVEARTAGRTRPLAVFVHTVDRKDVLGEIDADVDNGHGLHLVE